MLEDFQDQIQKNVPLKNLTTVALGGPAKEYISVTTPDQFLQLLKQVSKENIPYFLFGGGSNLLVSDEGVERLVIHNKVRGIKQEGNTVWVESGTPLQDLVDFTVDHGLSGVQKMTGIPGTVGGAVYGNAGAYGQAISDCLVEVITFDNQKEVAFSKEHCLFDYRTSIFKENKFPILRVKFKFVPVNQEILQKEAVEIATKRALNFPKGLCCPGSFFKNIVADNLTPEILQQIPSEKITFGKISAGYLLEAVGAKGQKLGDIQISPTHANLFINSGDGTAKEFWQLAKTYAQKVQEKFNISLEPEVQLIDLPPLSSSIE